MTVHPVAKIPGKLGAVLYYSIANGNELHLHIETLDVKKMLSLSFEPYVFGDYDRAEGFIRLNAKNELYVEEYKEDGTVSKREYKLIKKAFRLSKEF